MVTIRPATASDEEALGRYGGALMRQHHAADPKRFIDADDHEAAYGQFLVSQISRSSAAVLVAEHSGRVAGYVYAGIESTNWMKLRGPCRLCSSPRPATSARSIYSRRSASGRR